MQYRHLLMLYHVATKLAFSFYQELMHDNMNYVFRRLRIFVFISTAERRSKPGLPHGEPVIKVTMHHP